MLHHWSTIRRGDDNTIFINATVPGYCLSLNESEREKNNLFYKDIDKVLLIIKSANEDGNVTWIIG